MHKFAVYSCYELEKCEGVVRGAVLSGSPFLLRGGDRKMTLRAEIAQRFGSAYRFAKLTGVNMSCLYATLQGKRAVSKGLLAVLKGELGDDVAKRFDRRGVLIAGL